MRRSKTALACLLTIAVAALLAPPPAAAQGQRLFAFYSHAGGTELERLREVGSCIEVLAPNWYGLDVAEQRVGEREPDPTVLELSRSRGFEFWPVVNAQTGGSAVISEPAAGRRIADSIEALAARHDYAGVTLDIEGLTPDQGEAYTRLVEDLAGRLHAAGRKLAVYVPRRTAARPTNYAAPYDWAALSAAADLVLASGYNEHYAGGEPGPISTTAGFSAVVDYAASISAQRIAPTLGAFGYSWPADGGPGRLISTLDAERERAQIGAPGVFADGEVSYQAGDRTVWYEAASGLDSRSRVAADGGMSWLGLFSLGREPAEFWDRCRAPTPETAPPPAAPPPPAPPPIDLPLPVGMLPTPAPYVTATPEAATAPVKTTYRPRPAKCRKHPKRKRCRRPPR